MFDHSFTLFQQQGAMRGKPHPLGWLAQVQIWYADALEVAGNRPQAITVARAALETALLTAQISSQTRAMQLLLRLNSGEKTPMQAAMR